MHGAPEEDDAKVAIGSPVIKGAAALVALAGLFTAMTGLQIAMATDYYGSPLVHAIPFVQLAFGVGSILLAASVYRARTWSSVAAAGASLFAVLAMAAYLVVSLSWGVFSCVAVIAVGLWLLAAALSLVAVPAARKATAARERMRARGEDLGL